MSIPEFAAEASLYKAGTYYQNTGVGGTSDAQKGITIALDPCNRCSRLSGCAQARCYCLCYGGDWSPGHFGPNFPCGICF
jgi:hypothetical protein